MAYRRWITIVGLTLAVSLVGAACGDDDPAIDAGPAATDDLGLVKDGTLTVCSDIPYAPFEYEEGGQVVGIDADIMRALAKELEVEATFRDTDFDGIFSALAANQCDVIASSVSITDERKANNDFTAGYFEINQSLLVRKEDAAKYDSLAKLSGRTIGVQSETTGAAFAEENAKGANIREFTGADDLFLALKSKQIDGIVQDFPVNSYNATTSGETVVTEVFTSTEKEQYGFVVRKGNTALLKALDDALEAVRADGTYDTILEKYLGKGDSTPASTTTTA